MPHWSVILFVSSDMGFSAYSPDIDGCIATGSTKQEIEKNMEEAITFHLEGLALEYQEIPKPHTYSNYLEIMA